MIEEKIADNINNSDLDAALDINSIAAMPDELQEVTIHQRNYQRLINILHEQMYKSDAKVIKAWAEAIAFEADLTNKYYEKYENKKLKGEN